MNYHQHKKFFDEGTFSRTRTFPRSTPPPILMPHGMEPVARSSSKVRNSFGILDSKPVTKEPQKFHCHRRILLRDKEKTFLVLRFEIDPEKSKILLNGSISNRFLFFYFIFSPFGHFSEFFNFLLLSAHSKKTPPTLFQQKKKF